MTEVPEGCAYYVTQESKNGWTTFTIHLTPIREAAIRLADENGSLLGEGAGFVMYDGVTEIPLTESIGSDGYPVWRADLAVGHTYTLRQTKVTDEALYMQNAQWNVTVSEYGYAFSAQAANDAAYGAFESTLDGGQTLVVQDRFLTERTITLNKEWTDVCGDHTDGPAAETVHGVRVACAWTTGEDADDADWHEADVDLTEAHYYTAGFQVPEAATFVRFREVSYLDDAGYTMDAPEGCAAVSEATACYEENGHRVEQSVGRQLVLKAADL